MGNSKRKKEKKEKKQRLTTNKRGAIPPLHLTNKGTKTMTTLKYNDLSAFTKGYVDAMFFAADDYLSPETGFNDLTDEALATIVGDCAGFELSNSDLLSQAGTPTENGHDFWIARNRELTGFWSWNRFCPKNVGDALMCASRKYQEQSLAQGDDGFLYLEQGRA